MKAFSFVEGMLQNGILLNSIAGDLLLGRRGPKQWEEKISLDRTMPAEVDNGRVFDAVPKKIMPHAKDGVERRPFVVLSKGTDNDPSAALVFARCTSWRTMHGVCEEHAAGKSHEMCEVLLCFTGAIEVTSHGKMTMYLVRNPEDGSVRMMTASMYNTYKSQWVKRHRYLDDVVVSGFGFRHHSGFYCHSSHRYRHTNTYIECTISGDTVLERHISVDDIIRTEGDWDRITEKRFNALCKTLPEQFTLHVKRVWEENLMTRERRYEHVWYSIVVREVQDWAARAKTIIRTTQRAEHEMAGAAA